jgi:protein-disulfide isomerase
MLKSKKENKKKWKLLHLGIMSLVLLSIIIMTFGNFISSQSSKKLDGLPNLTAVEEKITATELDYSKQPSLGANSAPIKVIEFGDFKCPACKYFVINVKGEFLKDYVDTGIVQFFFVNYAFIDRDSYAAAAAGESLFRQGNELFWLFYDKLYEEQGNENEIWATKDFLINFVKENIPLANVSQFEEDLLTDKYLFDVKEDFKLSGALGVNGTPQFLINSVLYRINSYEELKDAIGQEMVKIHLQ